MKRDSRIGLPHAHQEAFVDTADENEAALAALLVKVRACTACADALPLGPRPVRQLATSATMLVTSQAPGTKVHQTGVPFSDPSGERLREWMGLSRDEFYNESEIAILPAGFCYPGRRGAGDAPPRVECTQLWRGQLLVGTYAQNHVLGPGTLTSRVRNFRDYLPATSRFRIPRGGRASGRTGTRGFVRT